MASLQDDLAQLLLPLTPQTRQQLETRCLSAHPLTLLSILEVKSAPNHPKQLAGVLLCNRLRECWSSISAPDRAQLQARMLHALDEPMAKEQLKLFAECAACIAGGLAAEGIMWLDLLLWIRKVAAEEECPSAQLRGAFPLVLNGLLTLPAWQSLLEPHLMECTQACVSVLKAERGSESDALECLGSLAGIVRGEEAARLFHHQVVGLLVSDAVMGSELCDAALEALSRAAAADELLIADASFYATPGLQPAELCKVL